jgi:hypothetical protein
MNKHQIHKKIFFISVSALFLLSGCGTIAEHHWFDDKYETRTNPVPLDICQNEKRILVEDTSTTDTKPAIINSADAADTVCYTQNDNVSIHTTPDTSTAPREAKSLTIKTNDNSKQVVCYQLPTGQDDDERKRFIQAVQEYWLSRSDEACSSYIAETYGRTGLRTYLNESGTTIFSAISAAVQPLTTKTVFALLATVNSTDNSSKDKIFFENQLKSKVLNSLVGNYNTATATARTSITGSAKEISLQTVIANVCRVHSKCSFIEAFNSLQPANSPEKDATKQKRLDEKDAECAAIAKALHDARVSADENKIRVHESSLEKCQNERSPIAIEALQ